jgi:hypothetical protein
LNTRLSAVNVRRADCHDAVLVLDFVHIQGLAPHVTLLSTDTLLLPSCLIDLFRCHKSQLSSMRDEPTATMPFLIVSIARRLDELSVGFLTLRPCNT